MQHTKFSKKSIVVLLILIVLVVIYICFHPWKLSVQKYFEQKPECFEVITKYFSEHPLDGRSVLLIERADIKNQFTNTTENFPTEVQKSIQKIFNHTNCEWIFITASYCQFESSNQRIEYGIIYLIDGSSGKDPLRAHIVQEKRFLSKNWMYYEVLTPLAEKEIPG